MLEIHEPLLHQLNFLVEHNREGEGDMQKANGRQKPSYALPPGINVFPDGGGPAASATYPSFAPLHIKSAIGHTQTMASRYPIPPYRTHRGNFRRRNWCWCLGCFARFLLWLARRVFCRWFVGTHSKDQIPWGNNIG